jgi:hypothetical protein
MIRALLSSGLPGLPPSAACSAFALRTSSLAIGRDRGCKRPAYLLLERDAFRFGARFERARHGIIEIA